MNRSTYLNALSMAGLLLLLKLIDYKYLVYDLKVEYYVGVIALLFTLLGLWIGRKLTATRPKEVLQPETVPSIKPSPAPLPPDSLGISPRENEVLRLIASGHSNQEIADRLFLSLNTVKKHTSTLFRKLEAERRTQAIEKARRIGLIE
jgi:DNA-binding CsgD family transcriptional regulator